MIYIAHRGLMDGPDPKKENHPDTLKDAWNNGFECEIDVWVVKDKFIFGHDNPQYEVSLQFILDNRLKSWFHCKNFEALNVFTSLSYGNLNFFWHEKDSYTLTSLNYIWTFPTLELCTNSICLLPELFLSKEEFIKIECYGVCSDYVKYSRILKGDN